MTLHVAYNHQCPRCEAYYIPYDEEVSCPNCSLVENKRFNFISRAVSSLQFNLREFGTYTPGAWWTGSLGDHILKMLFVIFEEFRKNNTTENFGVFAEQKLSNMEWGEQEYLKEHIYSIAVKVYEKLPDFEPY